jgi:retron-type reverse transcriptase
VKRAGHLFERVVEFARLREAALRAARGKRLSARAAAFLVELEANLIEIQAELGEGRYRPRPYETFEVREPKPRLISAAHFRDRVVHHALCAAIEPTLERYAIFDSYACRKGRGAHAAIARARHFCRGHERFLKLDVRKFFETCDHEVLKRLLRRLFKDRRLLDLTDRIIEHGAPGSSAGRGLPIGNLTSQHFANLYLGPLDHFVKERLGVRGYVRYMDDMLLFADDRASLRRWRREIERFAAGELRLDIKTEATVLAPVLGGVPFLGMRLWPGVARLGAGGRNRLARRLRVLQRQLAECEIEEETAVRSAASLVGWAAGADTARLRAGIMEDIFRRRDDEASNRVQRGGNWNNNANNCRSAQRNNNTPGNRNNNIGFRLASSRPGRTGAVHGPRSGAAAPTIAPPPAPSGCLSPAAEDPRPGPCR